MSNMDFNLDMLCLNQTRSHQKKGLKLLWRRYIIFVYILLLILLLKRPQSKFFGQGIALILFFLKNKMHFFFQIWKGKKEKKKSRPINCLSFFWTWYLNQKFFFNPIIFYFISQSHFFTFFRAFKRELFSDRRYWDGGTSKFLLWLNGCSLCLYCFVV